MKTLKKLTIDIEGEEPTRVIMTVDKTVPYVDDRFKVTKFVNGMFTEKHTFDDARMPAEQLFAELVKPHIAL